MHSSIAGVLSAHRSGTQQGVPTVWDPAFNPNDTITNGGRDVQVTSFTSGKVRTIFGANSGLWYFEMSPLGSLYAMCGVIAGSMPHGSNYPGSDNKSIGCFSSDGDIYFNSSIVGSVGAGFSVGTIGVILNAETGQVAFKRGLTTAFFNLSHTAGEYYYAAFGSGASTTSFCRINAGQESFVHGLPSGCQPIFGSA